MGPKITGHRGFSEKFPENTMLSFEQARKAGAERIELDVHASRDGRLVVHHDYYLGRTCAGSGLVMDHDWSQLAALDAGAWFAERFAGLRLPLLEEVFDRFGGEAEYEVELKGMTREFVREVLSVVEQRGLLDRVEFTSSRPVMLAALARLNPDALLGFFVAPYPEWMDRRLGALLACSTMDFGGFQVAHLGPGLLDEPTAACFRARGIKLHAADCNTEAELEQACQLGVDQISTDRVELAVEVRRRHASDLHRSSMGGRPAD